MPHGLHVPGARELRPAEPELRDTVELLHGAVDVAVGQARQADGALGAGAAEAHAPVVVDPEHLGGGLVTVQPGGGPAASVDALVLNSLALLLLCAPSRPP